MLKKNAAHEMAIGRKYHDNHKHKTTLSQKLRNRHRGAPDSKTHHLELKQRKCYPRGNAWYGIVDLHTIEWLNSH